MTTISQDTTPPPPAADPAAAAQIARLLLEVEAVLLRPDKPFTLTSGRRSPVYVDCRRLISFPRARRLVTDHAVAMLARDAGVEAFDIVAGGETAGIPFAAWIADRLGLPMVYVRKKPKGFGRESQIEGVINPGARVVLVEDLVTDGSSKVGFIEALRAAGAEVHHLFVIFHYAILPASAETMKALQVRLHALATWWDVLAAARAGGRFSPTALERIEAYLNDPEGWTP